MVVMETMFGVTDVFVGDENTANHKGLGGFGWSGGKKIAAQYKEKEHNTKPSQWTQWVNTFMK